MTATVFYADSGCVSDETVRDIARSLETLGEGVSRTAYDLGDVVLKVDLGSDFAGNCASEVEAWERIRGTDEERYVGRIFASGNGWLIMEKATHTLGWGNHDAQADEVRYALESIGIQDLHAQNLGYRPDGTLFALDYAFSSVRSSDRCECGEHDCRECWPNGCECETFEGCNIPECAECFEDAVTRVPEDGTWFGFRFGVHTNVWADGEYVGAVRSVEILPLCNAHKPKSETPKAQILGQRGFLIRGAEMFLPWEPRTSDPF